MTVRSATFVLALAGSGLSQQPGTVAASGRAIDVDGRPVAGCAVGVVPSNAGFDTKELLAQPLARTDEHGRYRVSAAKDGDHVLVVARPGHQVCVQRLHTHQGGDRVMHDALMLPGTTLRGRVRDPDGKPIANALVRVDDPLRLMWPSDAWFASQARTDASGIFSVSGVPRTGLRVAVHALGYGSRSRLAAHDSPLDVRLEATGVVRGRVVGADGKAVANAHVHVTTVEGQVDSTPAVTGADGRFEVSAPRAFRFRITAYEQAPPHRRCASGLLRGPRDDVVVEQVEAQRAPASAIVVRCVDAATKAPIERFRASWSGSPAKQSAFALMQHPRSRTEHRGEATIDVAASTWGKDSFGSVVVDAPGRGFAVADVPASGDGTLVVELPAESVLTGVVVDPETRKPAPGPAVRALPTGRHNSLHGGGPDPWTTGAVTDASGRYRIDGLAPGDYAVQVYVVGRQGSHSRTIALAAGTQQLDLEAPEPSMLQFDLAGDVPAGSLAYVTFDGMRTWMGVRNGVMLDAPLPPLPNVPIGTQREFTLGPVENGMHHVAVRIPARDRVGAGTTFPLGMLQGGRAETLRLPDLRVRLYRGTVALPYDVPRERVAVLAYRTDAPRRERALEPFGQAPFRVALDSDGAFAIDLPAGRYALQLVDLETDLVFHTEPEDRTLLADQPPAPIVMRPVVRWLTIALEPAVAGAPVVLHSLAADPPSPRDDLPATLQRVAMRDNARALHVPYRSGTREARWLVPTARFEVHAVQDFGALARARDGREPTSTSAEVPAGTADARVELRVPPPPSDELLESPK